MDQHHLRGVGGWGSGGGGGVVEEGEGQWRRGRGSGGGGGAVEEGEGQSREVCTLALSGGRK